MHLSDSDWQMFHAYPRLVEYLTETTRNMRTTHCARLKLYLTFARIILAMCNEIQVLAKPSNYQRPNSTDQRNYQEKQVAELIATHDPDFYGMALGQHLSTQQQLDVSYTYARTVVGSENDPNCDLILDVFRQAGFSVPASAACR